MHLLQHRQGLGFTAHRPVASGGDPRLLHQLLGPGFARLQLGPLRSRAEHGKARIAQGIGNTSGQRRFRTHHHQVDAVLLAQRDQPSAIGFAHRHGAAFRAAVARGDPDRVQARTTAQGPGQGLFPAAATDDEGTLEGGQRGGTGGRHGHGCGRNGLGLVGFPL